MTRRRSRQRRPGRGWGVTGSHVLLVLGGLAAVLTVGTALGWILNDFTWAPVGNWLHEFSTGAALGGTLAVASAVLAVLAANRRLEHDRLNHLHERYEKTAKQIGDDKPAIRLAGVYAMAALADEWLTVKQDTRDAQACVDVLCSYLRMDLRPPEQSGVSDTRNRDGGTEPSGDEQKAQRAEAFRKQAAAQEAEVRHAVIGLIRDRRWGDRNIKLNLAGANLERMDLSGADLARADLTNAYLMVADLVGANLAKSDLRWAMLTKASLTGASLMGANVRGGDLRGSDLTGANLREADLRETSLSLANFKDADLRGADLRGADRAGAHLEGANLEGALLIDLPDQ